MSAASELSRRLAREAETVCRTYLPAGRRHGGYWVAGDVQGTPGRSLFLRLSGDRAGHWTDAATGEHGDLLDLIHLNRGHAEFRETLDEARRFLRDPEPIRASHRLRRASPSPDVRAAAEKLYALSRPVPGTLAEIYLHRRAITASLHWRSLRFHPACYYRAHRQAPHETWPALLGIVTDLAGNLTGLQRTWLARDGSAKAPLADPRRALGHLLGNAVRFGAARHHGRRRGHRDRALASLALSGVAHGGRSVRRASFGDRVPGWPSPSLRPPRQRQGWRLGRRAARRTMRRGAHRGAYPEAFSI